MWIVALFIGNAMLNWGANFTQEMTIARVGQNLLYRLRGEMFHHLQKQSVSFYDKNEVGRIMSRVLGDVYQLQEFLSVAVITVGNLLSLVGIAVAVLILSIQLGLISLVTIPLLILVMAVWQPFARKAFMRVRRAAAIVNGSLNENISGVRVVQAMNRQERNAEIFETKNRENHNAAVHASGISSGLLPSVDLLTAISIGLVLFFGARLVGSNALEVGALVAFVMYIQRFFDPIRSLTMQYTQLQRAMASGIRIFELLDTKPDLEDKPGARDLPPIQGPDRVQGRQLQLRRGPGRAKAREHARPAGPDRRRRWTHRRRQDDPRLPHVQVLRRGGGPGRDTHRRPRHPQQDARVPGPPDQHGPPGALPVHRHRQGEHQVHPPATCPTRT